MALSLQKFSLNARFEKFISPLEQRFNCVTLTLGAQYKTDKVCSLFSNFNRWENVNRTFLPHPHSKIHSKIPSTEEFSQHTHTHISVVEIRGKK